MVGKIQVLCLIVLLGVVANAAARSHLSHLLSYESDEFHYSTQHGGKRAVEQADCTLDGTVCHVLVDGTTGQFTNNAYIEMSLQVKFTTHKKVAIYVDGKKINSWQIRTVLPARAPGGDPVVVDVFTMKIVGEGEASWNWVYQTKFGSYKAKHAKTAKYRLPFSGKYKVGQGYNGKSTHTGENAYSIDFTMAEGTRVLAPRDGIVVAIQNSNYRSKYEDGLCPKPVRRTCDATGSDDNHVFVRYDDMTFGMFAHFKQDGVTVSPGDTVSAGQLLGYSGNTGLSTGPHLHVSVNKCTPFDFGRKWNSESIKVSYVDANGKTVTPTTGKEYEGSS
jgi:murein DD-endopeptidase MepM/ murein hydrolase activator NlpD